MPANVRWLGHSAFHLSGGGADVLVDPWLTGNPKGAVSADELPADVIALTHGHGDHLGDTVAIAKRTGAKVLAIVELAAEIEGDGVEDVVGFNFGGTVQFDWGWVKMVPAWHTAVSPAGTPHMPAGLLIHYGGHLIYHLGDTALFSDLQLIARRGDRVELALVPIGGHYTMDRFDAVTAVEFVNPFQTIPIHYGTFPPVETDAQAFKTDVEQAGSRRCSCSIPATLTHCDDPRRRTHRSRALRDCQPGRPARRRRRRSRGLQRHRRVGFRRDPARPQPRRGRAGRHAPLRRHRGDRPHPHDGRVRGLLPARP